MTIFTLQPHKEERFMYPVYPFLALNAAVAFDILLSSSELVKVKAVIEWVPSRVRLAVMLTVVVLSLEVAMLRTIGLVSAYRAPLRVYRGLEHELMTHPGETVCLGKEWYRFPSSHFLPEGVKAKFVKSEFSGLLPGEFSEARTGFGFFPGAWLIPGGMNDRNEEDMSKYVSPFRSRFYIARD